MKKVLVISCVCLLLVSSTFVYAQSKNWADYGLSEDDIQYLSEQEKQDILNSNTPEQTIKKIESGDVSTSSIESFPPSVIPTLENINLKNTAPALSQSVLGCFDYYTFGSISANMSSQSSNVISGTTMDFFGDIKNNNNYPIVQGTLYVKIFKNVGGEKNPNGPEVVDQFIAIDNITIPANGSIPAQFSWEIPTYAQTGDYKMATYFTSDKKFNLMGLSFTDDVIGNSFEFKVNGENKGVEFDKTSAIINNNPYYFATFPPRISPEDNTNISISIKNTTDILQSAKVEWKLYKWDAMNPDNFVRSFTTDTLLKPNSQGQVSFTVSEKDEPVYYLVGELTYKDTKSIVGIRFVREGVDKARLNFPSIVSYPLKKGESSTVFTCLHNSGTSSQIPDNKVILEIKDKTGRVIESYTYDGIITGDMMAVKKDFVSKVNLDVFSVHASLYSNNKLIDESTMNYDCKLIDPTKCQKTNYLISTGISLLIILLILIGLGLYKKRQKNLGVIAILFLCFFSFSFFAHTAEAKDVNWTTSPVVSLSYFWNWAGTSAENNGSGWEPALKNPSISVKYKAEIKNKETGAVISDGSSVPVGTELILSFLPHVSEDIYWFGTGYSGDSPYGEWRKNSEPPAARTCNTKDYVTKYHSVGSIKTKWFTFNYDEYYDVYIPLVVSPPEEKTLSNTDGMTCTAISETSWDCIVTQAGTINPKFNFGDTSGKFYYRYWDFRSGVVKNRPAGCYGNNIALKNGSSTYILNVPAQTIPYTLTAIQPPTDNLPPLAPTIIGPSTGDSDTEYNFNISSTDPDGDKINYGVDWDNDGTVDQWLPSSGFVDSGTVEDVGKSWVAGTYTFSAIAQDQYGLLSDWSSHTITVSNSSGFSVSCSASPVSVGAQATFTAMPINNIGQPTYQWKESNGVTNISGATSELFTRTYSTIGSYKLYISATDQGITKTNSCYVTVGCDNTHTESETTACDPATNTQGVYHCTSSGWVTTTVPCGGVTPPGGPLGGDPVADFSFDPGVVGTPSSFCGLTLTASNVSDCTLLSLSGNISLTSRIVNNTINLNKLTGLVKVGRYTLSCAGTTPSPLVDPVIKTFGTETCLLNPDIRER